jgi:phosphatidylethanolamine-binding protein (PEBP) family uncharacterized protein
MRQQDYMRRPVARAAFVATALAAMLAIAGCGGSSTSSTQSTASAPPSTTQASEAQRQSATPTSPAISGEPPPHQTGNHSEHTSATTVEASIPGLIGSERQIPTRYTCDGADTSLPVTWSKIPHGTAQIALFLLNLRPVNNKLFIDWAVTGISPTAHGIAAGALPSGAVAARNSYGKIGYSVCPPTKGAREIYVLRVAALPHALNPKPGVDAETLYHESEQIATNVGLSGGTYTRP